MAVILTDAATKRMCSEEKLAQGQDNITFSTDKKQATVYLTDKDGVQFELVMSVPRDYPFKPPRTRLTQVGVGEVRHTFMHDWSPQTKLVDLAAIFQEALNNKVDDESLQYSNNQKLAILRKVEN